MISVIIPTLQKCKKTLCMLLDVLTQDSSVGEIIIIDNSLKGLDYKHDKIKLIIPEANMYVNPSWNLGVELAKYETVGLLNDDIAVPKDFCTKIEPKITDKIGIVGISMDEVIQLDEITCIPDSSELYIEKASYMDYCFGVAMFFNKKSYCKIPDEIKIVYGDNWIFDNCKINKLQNYRITNQKIYHHGSLSSGQKTFNVICQNDAMIYKKLMIKWWQRLFSFEERYDEYKLRLLGITFRLKKL